MTQLLTGSMIAASRPIFRSLADKVVIPACVALPEDELKVNRPKFLMTEATIRSPFGL